LNTCLHENGVFFFFFFYSCCSHLEHRTSVKRFVSLLFLNLRESVGPLGRGMSPSQGRYLTQTQNKHKEISMPWVGFETTIPVLERAKIFHTLDRLDYAHICPCVKWIWVVPFKQKPHLSPSALSTNMRQKKLHLQEKRRIFNAFSENWRGCPRTLISQSLRAILILGVMSLLQLDSQMVSSFQIFGQTFCRHVSSLQFVLQVPSIHLDFLKLITFIASETEYV
jgi:hypothetical protein